MMMAVIALFVILFLLICVVALTSLEKDDKKYRCGSKSICEQERENHAKKKESLTVLVDMDDTIEELCEAWVDYLNEKYGTNVSVNDIRDWDITTVYQSLSEEQIFEPLYQDEFWKTVKPMSGAQKYLKDIVSDGHSVYICTNSHYKTIVSKMDNVLFKYFPFLDWDHVIIASNKQMILADVLVDDGIHNLVGGSYIPILIDRPHNRSFDAEKNGVIRVTDWQEVYDCIQFLFELRGGDQI